MSLNPSAKKSGSPDAAAVASSPPAAAPASAAAPDVEVVVESAKASVVKGDAPNASSMVAAAVVDAPHGSTTSFMGVTAACIQKKGENETKFHAFNLSPSFFYSHVLSFH